MDEVLQWQGPFKVSRLYTVPKPTNVRCSSTSYRSGEKPVLVMFKNNTDIPPKCLNSNVGKFWWKVAEHPGLYVKQTDINNKVVPLVALVPEEILVRTFRICIS